jgi:hypothetical protein
VSVKLPANFQRFGIIDNPTKGDPPTSSKRLSGPNCPNEPNTCREVAWPNQQPTRSHAGFATAGSYRHAQ